MPTGRCCSRAECGCRPRTCRKSAPPARNHKHKETHPHGIVRRTLDRPQPHHQQRRGTHRCGAHALHHHAVAMQTVLVVDPSRVARAVVRECLAAFPCRVVEAAEGAAAVVAARRERFGLIIADRHALATLRAEVSCTGIPVVALIASAGRGTPAPADVAGCLVKPFGRRAFEAAVAGLLAATPETTAEEVGCTVLRLPDARMTAAGDLLESAIRTLAEDGRDTLILDLARVTEVNTELVAHIGRAIAAARAAGMRTGICAPDARVRAGLTQLAETRNTPCEATRDAVRGRLTGTC